MGLKYKLKLKAVDFVFNAIFIVLMCSFFYTLIYLATK